MDVPLFLLAEPKRCLIVAYRRNGAGRKLLAARCAYRATIVSVFVPAWALQRTRWGLPGGAPVATLPRRSCQRRFFTPIRSRAPAIPCWKCSSLGAMFFRRQGAPRWLQP